MQIFSSPHRFRRHLILSFAWVLLTILAGSAGAQFTGSFLHNTEIVIAPGTEIQEIPISALHSVASYEDPLHGTVVPTSNGFNYYPNPSFWAVGRDTMIVEVTSGRQNQGTIRFKLIVGALDPAENMVYSTSVQGLGGFSQPWIFYSPIDNPIETVTGTVAPLAYQMSLDTSVEDQPKMIVIHDNTAGHQQTSEHTVNISVDDLDIRKIPQLGSELSFYRITQNNQIVVELKAQYDFLNRVWKVRPTTPGNNTFVPEEFHPGYHPVKLVRWGTPGASGADFYIGERNVGTLHNLPLMGLGPEIHELTQTQTEEYDGLRMRFEEPKIVVGQSLSDPSDVLQNDTFDDILTNPSWDQVVGATYLSTSPQTLAGTGEQLDIDLGSIPHWQHAYVRQDYLTEPLDNFNSRFWLDPSLVDLPEGGHLRIVYGCTNSAADWCVSFRLLLVKENGAYELRLYSWDDVGGEHLISTPFSMEPHYVEIQFRTGVAPGLPTGWAKLWVDGTAVGSSTQLDNANKKVEDVRIGTNYTASTSTGTLSIDELVIWNK